MMHHLGSPYFFTRLARRLPIPVLVAVCLVATPAQAGLTELDLVLVNMTPDPVSDAGRDCSQAIRRALAGNQTVDRVSVRNLGETALRDTLEGETGDFMGWSEEVHRDLLHDGERLTGEIGVLFSCQPDEARFEALIVNSSGGSVELRLQHTVTGAIARVLAGRVAHHATPF